MCVSAQAENTYCANSSDRMSCKPLSVSITLLRRTRVWNQSLIQLLIVDSTGNRDIQMVQLIYRADFQLQGWEVARRKASTGGSGVSKIVCSVAILPRRRYGHVDLMLLTDNADWNDRCILTRCRLGLVVLWESVSNAQHLGFNITGTHHNFIVHLMFQVFALLCIAFPLFNTLTNPRRSNHS